eukprot:SAG31_NODE_1587_length_7819_cov_3.703277_4_plen_32_part_00
MPTFVNGIRTPIWISVAIDRTSRYAFLRARD